MKRVNAWCDCGWHGSYASEGIADYARRKHSCNHWRAKRAKARRGADRMRAVDRTPKPCPHDGRHEHGTRNAYVLDRCRCLPCAKAASEYESWRKRQRAYGRDAFTDAEPVREHVRRLMDAGMGLKTVAARTGVSHGTLAKLVYGTRRPDGTRRDPSKRVTLATARKLLALRLDVSDLADGARIDTTGTRRRLQALACAGWSVGKLETASGVDRQALDKILRGGTRTSARTVKAVADIYDQLWDQVPPHEQWHDKAAYARTINRANSAGWAPAMAWDDETIDDPTAEPADAASTVGADDRLTEWLHLVRSGEDHGRAAARVGITLESVERSAYRLGRDDVVKVLTAAAAARREEHTHVIPTETRPRKRRVAA
ncbi:hypothetical protein GCM10027059_26780 [Myceligenerans halotolerans]